MKGNFHVRFLGECGRGNPPALTRPAASSEVMWFGFFSFVFGWVEAGLTKCRMNNIREVLSPENLLPVQRVINTFGYAQIEDRITLFPIHAESFA